MSRLTLMTEIRSFSDKFSSPVLCIKVVRIVEKTHV